MQWSRLQMYWRRCLEECEKGRKMQISSRFTIAVHAILDMRLEAIQKAMEKEMKSITIQDVMNDAKKLIEV